MHDDSETAVQYLEDLDAMSALHVIWLIPQVVFLVCHC